VSLTISSNRESSGVSVQVLRSVSQHLTQVATIWRIGQVTWRLRKLADDFDCMHIV
jgi:hypothetical protein